MRKYIYLIGFVGAITAVFAFKTLWDVKQNLKKENEVMQQQIEINERNVQLLSDLLDSERKTREAAMDALSELSKDVPDVVYSQELPPSIQNVLDRFHNRIRINP